MLYINTYLDKIGELIRGEVDPRIAFELTDETKIAKMFENDCKKIVQMYRSGEASYEDVKRNLTLLRSYVVTQLELHFEKIKEFARSKGVEIDKTLDPAVVNEIALYINKTEKEL